MTAIHPHQLKPDQIVRDRAAACLSACGPQPAVPLVGVVQIAKYLRLALGLTIHRELVLAWIHDGMPATRFSSRDQIASRVTYVTTDNQVLAWLREHGSSLGPRLGRWRVRALPASTLRRYARQGIAVKARPRKRINPMRGGTRKVGKRKQEPVPEV